MQAGLPNHRLTPQDKWSPRAPQQRPLIPQVALHLLGAAAGGGSRSLGPLNTASPLCPKAAVHLGAGTPGNERSDPPGPQMPRHTLTRTPTAHARTRARSPTDTPTQLHVHPTSRSPTPPSGTVLPEGFTQSRLWRCTPHFHGAHRAGPSAPVTVTVTITVTVTWCRERRRPRPQLPAVERAPGGGGAPLSAAPESLVAPPFGRRPSLSCSCTW